MVDLRLIEMHGLMEMLAMHTQDYTQMLNDNEKGEIFDNCKQKIELIQQEIYSRERTPENTSISTPDADFIIE